MMPISSSVSPLRQLARSNQFVNLSIRRVNLTSVQLAVGLRSGSEALVHASRRHLLDERHHAVVAGDVEQEQAATG